MQVAELKDALSHIRDLMRSGGAAAAEKDLDQLIGLLDGAESVDLDSFIEGVAQNLAAPASAPRPGIAEHIARLTAAGLDEPKFKDAFGHLKSEKGLSKEQLLAIAKGFGVIYLDQKSKASVVESIEKHFYWALYNRDANEMAKRATPW